jgi:beta-mannanase
LDLPDNRVSVGVYDPWLAVSDDRLTIEHWYANQADPELISGALAHARNHHTPLLTIEPHPLKGQRGPVLEAVLGGVMDDQVRQVARAVRASSPQIALIRWGHEMELSGLYPWAANRPDLYRAAYRRVVSLFEEEGASNARFVWSPAGEASADAYFPGDDVVDYIGLTVLGDANWDWAFGLPPQSFAQLLAPRYRRVEHFRKPIIIAELGVSGPPERQAAWVVNAARALEQFPRVRALVYFDEKNPDVKGLQIRPDWRIKPALLSELVDTIELVAAARAGV